MNALAPDKMSADERLKEISELLATAILRRRAREIIPADIALRMKWGRDKTYKVLTRLMEFSYIARTQERDLWTQSFGDVVYTVYSNSDDNPNLRVKTAEPLPEAPLPENTDHIIRTDRDQKYIKGRILKAAVPTHTEPATKIVRRDARRDQLADRLSPHDRKMGYEMLTEGAVLDELLRKLIADTLTEADLVPIKRAYIARGLPAPQ